jgi:plastocyanin
VKGSAQDWLQKGVHLMQWRSTVQREKGSKPKGFSPQTQQAQVGDAIFWFNEDSHTQHQPYPTSPPGKPGDWGPLVPGQNSSQQLNLDKAGTYDYKCALHTDETGHIIVANGVVIGPSGTGAATVAPSALSIVAGECVSWGNSDANAHQPTPDQGAPWFTKPISSGDISAPITFASAGTVPYHCALHKNAASERGIITITKP